jgi:hypothetical protein
VYSAAYSDFVKGCRTGTISIRNVVDCYNKALYEISGQIERNKKELSAMTETSEYFEGDENDFYLTELKLYSRRLSILSLEGMHKADFVTPECLHELEETRSLKRERELFKQVEIDPSKLNYDTCAPSSPSTT